MLKGLRVEGAGFRVPGLHLAEKTCFRHLLACPVSLLCGTLAGIEEFIRSLLRDVGSLNPTS